MTTAENYFQEHAGRVGYAASKWSGQVIGSRSVESAVRRVVNLRLKGNSIFWREEHAELVLHLRAQWLSGRWQSGLSRGLDATQARLPLRWAA